MKDETLEQRKAELWTYLGSKCQNVTITRVVTEGDPAGQIVENAHTQAADLIVMATHAYGPFRRHLLGSVTAKVLHDVQCPVWTAPHTERPVDFETVEFRRVLCAVDLVEGSAAVLEWASNFAQAFGATLAVVHVLPGSLLQLGGVYFDPEWRSQAAKSVQEQIVRLPRAPGEILVEIGNVPTTVSDVAARWKADLLVIGRGGQPGIPGRLHTNAYAILRESPCPVVTI
jgi:nucleotide-binding universal stress UspA family protein